MNSQFTRTRGVLVKCEKKSLNDEQKKSYQYTFLLQALDQKSKHLQLVGHPTS